MFFFRKYIQGFLIIIKMCKNGEENDLYNNMELRFENVEITNVTR